MSEFKKPQAMSVHAPDYIKNLIDASLKKDLYENEEVCGHCCGTGMVIADNPYGITEDPDKRAGRFPYKHQSITFCPHCFNGIVRRCNLCGNLIKRGWIRCDCDAQREIERQDRLKKKQEILDNAPIAPKEIVDTMECFFSEHFSNNEGYFFDWEEFFEDWFENHEPEEVKPTYVWITELVEMSIDAGDIVEHATEDLYEDAGYDIRSEKIKELQDFLDGWCKSCGVSKTYYESHEYKVRIPWEEYEEGI